MIHWQNVLFTRQAVLMAGKLISQNVRELTKHIKTQINIAIKIPEL